MPPELDTETNQNPATTEKVYSNDEITKILNTAQTTRKERDAIASRAKEIEDSNKQLQAKLEKIKTIDPKRYQELELQAARYEEENLEKKQKFIELKELWGNEKSALQKEVQKIQESLLQERITNALEKAFYAARGKVGNDEDGYSYFDPSARSRL